MKAGKKPEHCKGCKYFHNAGHPKTSNLQTYNAWCLAKCDAAANSIGWCKQNDMKRTEDKDV